MIIFFLQQYEKDLFKDMQAPDPTTLALAANALRLKEIETVKKSTSGKFNNNNVDTPPY